MSNDVFDDIFSNRKIYVKEYNSTFPPVGQKAVIYIDTNVNALYRWTGSAYEEIGQYPQVDTYADLPPATDNTGKIYFVKTKTGIWPLDHPSGFYYSNGTTWEQAPMTAGALTSSDVIDNLTSNTTNKPLSANQGKVLKDLIDGLTPDDITGFNEAVDDEVNALIQDSANSLIVWAYDDVLATLTPTFNYNTTNLKITAGELDTIQSIAVGAAPSLLGTNFTSIPQSAVINLVSDLADKQNQDNLLDSISTLSGNGIIVRKNGNDAETRQIVAGSSKISITNGNGVSANPTIDLGTVAISDITDLQTTLDGKQPLNQQLTDIAGLTPADSNIIVGNGITWAAESGATARTSLGLGSIATQNANSIAITGGNLSGISKFYAGSSSQIQDETVGITGDTPLILSNGSSKIRATFNDNGSGYESYLQFGTVSDSNHIVNICRYGTNKSSIGQFAIYATETYVNNNLKVNSLTASQLVASDANKNLVSGNLSGDVSSSGLSTTIGASKVTNTMLAGSIDQSKITNLTSDLASKEPTITAGTSAQYWRGDKSWQALNTNAVAESSNLYFTNARVRSTDLTGLSITGSSIVSTDTILQAFGKLQNQINGVAVISVNGAIGAVSLTGTANKIVVSGTTWDIAPTYAGQNSITTLGTITSGVWNGTKLGEAYGGTNQSSYVLGDILYSSSANTLSKLAGNTTTTKKYLSQTGNGTISAAPSWQQINFSDLAGSIAAGQITDASITYAKIQNVSATNRLLGRSSAGAGVVEEISTIPSAILGGSSLYIGTTQIALNRSSSPQVLTGITSIDGFLTQTNTGKTGNIGFISPTNQADWSNYPVGLGTMINANKMSVGAATNDFNYFFKVANRDVAGGWGGITVNMSNGKLYSGKTDSSSNYATWKELAFVSGSDAITVSSDSDTATLLNAASTAGSIGLMPRSAILSGGGVSYVRSAIVGRGVVGTQRVVMDFDTWNGGGGEEDMKNVRIYSQGNVMLRLNDKGVYIGANTGANAALELKAGTTSLAPFKLNSGSDLTTAQAGSFEFGSSRLAFTPSGTTRKRVVLTSDSAPATGQIPVGNGTDFSNNAIIKTGQLTIAISGTGEYIETTFLGLDWATANARVFCNVHEIQNGTYAPFGDSFYVMDAFIDDSGTLRVRIYSNSSSTTTVYVDYFIIR